MSNPIFRAAARWFPLLAFKGSQDYWQKRYSLGGDSGAGSFGDAAAYKTRVLNAFVAENQISSLIEFGCGDGRQLEHARYPTYLGLDISAEAIRICRERFAGDASKRFMLADAYAREKAEAALSLDVIYHLVEDSVYAGYLQRLFAAAERFVVIYSSDESRGVGNLPHVRHRKVSEDVAIRFPDFVRRTDLEALLPEPVEYNRKVPTRFLFFSRRET